jgi:hypothetical protein
VDHGVGGLSSEASGSNMGSPRKRLGDDADSGLRTQASENKTKIAKKA